MDPFGKGRSNQSKIFQSSYLCDQFSYIVPLVSFYFSKMPVIYLNLQLYLNMF